MVFYSSGKYREMLRVQFRVTIQSSAVLRSAAKKKEESDGPTMQMQSKIYGGKFEKAMASNSIFQFSSMQLFLTFQNFPSRAD